MRVLIVGAGLSGCVLAERHASLGHSVLVIEKRDHIAGNCYDYMDENNIRISKYGPHFFHTNSEKVWKYINKFATWKEYKHKAYGRYKEKQFPIPMNLTTVNVVYNVDLKNETEMKEFLQDKLVEFPEITNSEEYALSKFGRELYETVIKGYTEKQWEREVKELDPSVVSRIPLYYDFFEGYYKDTYQCIPEEGYTEFCKRMLSSPNIEVRLNTEYSKKLFDGFDRVFITGRIDSYFEDHNLPQLEYRSLEFKNEELDVEYFQPHTQINYTEKEVPYTRIVEHKYLYPVDCKKTVITKEYPRREGEPYYPIPSKRNLDLYAQYKELADKEEEKGIYFVGRLANYKYFNMDQAILNSLEFFERVTGQEST
jgi:UDP-galactopyranose mutase